MTATAGTGDGTGELDAVDPATGRVRTIALPIASLCLGAIAALIAWRTASDLAWIAARLEVLAVVLLAIGIGLRSEQVIALATGPALVGLLVGTVGRAEIAWGQALIVGCLWYLATEAALSSAEWSGGLRVSAGVLQRRVLDVATVVLVGSSVVALGFVIAGWAPDRTITARVVVLVVVIAALGAGIRHLVTVDRAGDRLDGRHGEGSGASPDVRSDDRLAEDLSPVRRAQR